jgi:hypothetical protein
MHLRHEFPIQFYQVNGLDLTNLGYYNASLPMYQVHALKAHVQKPVHPSRQCTKARAPTPALQNQCILFVHLTKMHQSPVQKLVHFVRCTEGGCWRPGLVVTDCSRKCFIYSIRMQINIGHHLCSVPEFVLTIGPMGLKPPPLL